MSFQAAEEFLEGNIQRSWGQIDIDWDPFGLLRNLSRIFSSGSVTIGTPALPGPIYQRPPVDVIDENTTWEEYEELYPEHFEPILETRPGRVADSYPQDVSDSETPEDDGVATTWTEWGIETASAIVGNILQPDAAPLGFAPTGPLGPSTPANQTATAAAMAGCDGMAWSGGTPPKGYKVVNHCGVGVLRRIRRRRRPRIATNSDLADISAIVGIVGKGQLATALISRRGR